MLYEIEKIIYKTMIQDIYTLFYSICKPFFIVICYDLMIEK